MIMTKTIAAGLIALSSLAAVPANASGITIEIGGGPGWNYDGGSNWNHDGGRRHHRHVERLSTDEIRWMLRDDGYRQIRFFDDRGAFYQLRASKHGRDFFLVVSARSGEILSRQRI